MIKKKSFEIKIGDMYLDCGLELFIVHEFQNTYKNDNLNWVIVFSCTELKLKRRYPFEFDDFVRINE